MAEGKRLLPVEDGNKQFAFAVVQLLEKESEILGSGSYGTVCKAKCDEIMCAAKKIYPALFQVEPIEPGREHTHPLQRFEIECDLLKNIDHPNIVQYLGIYRDPDTNAPVLLMELMDESLTHFLESSPGDIPYHIQVNLSYDIAQALAFLHSNGIIHRDLSSNNVLLLAGNRAKITDFGMSTLIDTSRAQMTKCPGTPAFMPPEALDDSPVYTKKLDNFSFGVLIVQMLTRRFPKPADRFKVISGINPTDPTLSVRAQVPEVKRREAHINLIDPAHPLLAVALDCLKDHDTKRPTSQELCQTFHSIKLSPHYQGSVQHRKDQTIHMNNKETIIEKLSEKINDLTRENEARTRQLRELNDQLQLNEQVIAQQQQEISRKEREIAHLQQMYQNAHIHYQQAEMSTQQVENSEPITERETMLTLEHESTKQVENSKPTTEGEIKLTLDDIPDTISHVSPAVVEDTVYIKLNEQVIAQQQQEIGRNERETAHLHQMHQIAHIHQQQAEMSTQHHVENSEPTTEGEIKLTLDNSIDIPDKISHVSPAVVGDTVYIKSANKNVILEYDTNKGTWSVIKNHPISSGGFSIVNINDVLTTVGGNGIFTSNKLYCYKPTLKTWAEIFPPMPFRDRSPAVVCTQNHLVVITTETVFLEETIKVAVMNTDTHEWFRLTYKTPLKAPILLFFGLKSPQTASAIISQNGLYVKLQLELLNHAKAYVFSLPDIIEKSMKEVSRDVSESIDYNSFVTPNFSRVFELRKKSFLIFKNKQVIGEMSVPRANCKVAVLPHNKVMLIGYETNNKCSADIFTIRNNYIEL